MAWEKSIGEVIQKASEFRGKIINETIYLEKVIDTYIATYFCDDKLRMTEMHHLFLGDNRITFDNKKQIFDYLCKTHDGDWYRGYKSRRSLKLKKETPQISADLDYIIQKRNLLAHVLLDTSLKARSEPDGKIYFVKFKNERKPFEYNASRFMDDIMVIHEVTNYIIVKLNELSKSPYHPLNSNPK